MRPPSAAASPLPLTRTVIPSSTPGLTLLLEAAQYAQSVKCDPWEFAVEITCLRKAGLTNSALRWLVCQGYVEQAWENRRAKAQGRSFHKIANLALSARSCFVLAQAGIAYAHQQCQPAGQSPWDQEETGQESVPRWDDALRELRLGSSLVKQFKQPAPSQELILAAFQEEGWPASITDPLPPKSEQDQKRRLHSTINNLNRGQRGPWICFRGCGTGQAISWKVLCRTVPQSDTTASPQRD
jgi:hypothetical protein